MWSGFEGSERTVQAIWGWFIRADLFLIWFWRSSKTTQGNEDQSSIHETIRRPPKDERQSLYPWHQAREIVAKLHPELLPTAELFATSLRLGFQQRSVA